MTKEMTEEEIIKELTADGTLIFYALRGSRLYGTDTADSDYDYHGIFAVPKSEWLRLFQPCQKREDSGKHVVFYGLRHYVNLAMKANPTVIEMMWTPEDAVIEKNYVSEELFKHRDLFVTKKCFYSFSGYANEQIRKATGKNKKVHGKEKYVNENGISKLRELLFGDAVSAAWVESRFCKAFLEFLTKGDVRHLLTDNTDWNAMDVHLEDEDIASLDPPRRIQFCRFFSLNDFVNLPTESNLERDMYLTRLTLENRFPMRPVSIKEAGIDLAHFHCSSIEHLPNAYRLYRYGEKAKGVFCAGRIVCQSIPKEDEWSSFYGVLEFQENEYQSAKKQWRSYWEWRAKRNDARWRDAETGEQFTHDCKNMQHTVRILLSGENIAREGAPLLRFDPKTLQFLRDIRAGVYEYDYLMKYARDKTFELRELFDKSSLPGSCNTKKVDALYSHLVDIWR